MSNSGYDRYDKNGAQFTVGIALRLWTSERALISTITSYFDLQRKTYMEWRKYQKKDDVSEKA